VPRPVLGVVYDKGSAGPAEILSALKPIADVVLLVPDNDHARQIAPLLKLMGCEVRPLLDRGRTDAAGVEGLVTFSEARVRQTAETALRHALPGHQPDTAAALTDKDLQRRSLRDQGLDRTRSELVQTPDRLSSAIAVVGLPAILKPQFGEGSAFTTRVDTVAAASEAAEAYWTVWPDRAVVIETFLEGRPSQGIGDYVSVEVASQGGAHDVIAVTGKLPLAPPFRETGQFWPSTLSEAEVTEASGLAVRAVHGLGVVDGISHVELKLTSTGPGLIEVNGRLGGNLNDLSLRSRGENLIELAGRIALGLPIEHERPRPAATFYQHYHLAPRWASRLSAVQGVAEIRALPFVDSYRLVATTGADLRADSSTEPLDILCGTAGTGAEMLEQLSTARSLAGFVFTDGHGVDRAVRAAELPGD
jgi:hypothetical protein